jgi:pyruvate dehydrogenase E2 component (dihydrolipoamide acetyltransferase)
MAAELKVPKLGMDMEEAEIVRWIVEEGAEVEKGDPVLEIDTDKVAYEIEANAAGTIQSLKGAAGEKIKVGATLAYIVAPGEEWQETEEAAETTNGSNNAVSSENTGSPQPVGEKPENLEHQNGRRVRASPAARRAAAARDLTLNSIAGSGPAGRIYLSDVLETDIRQEPVDDAPLVASSYDGNFREKLSRVRRVGAERTAKSFSEVPHFYLNRDLVVDRLLDLRERLASKMDPSPSLTELLALAISRTLKNHPRLNASYIEGGEIEIHPHVNLGIAASTDEGLLVPVLKNAEDLSLRSLVPAVKDLVRRTRASELETDELSGGTFTISNLGMMGVDNFDAIINAPQAAILALGRTRTIPEWRDGEWLPQHVISATLSVDHRVADGADGARFLEDLQTALSNWEILL